MQKIKLALCDDMKPFCRYLQRSFSKEDDIEIVGIANSAKECLEMVSNVKPDVLLLDIQMETYNPGTEIIPHLIEKSPDTQIIMLTVNHDDEQIFKALTYGAVDYKEKTENDSEILDLVRKVYNNTAVVTPEIMQAVVNESKKLPSKNSSLLYVINIISKLTTSEYHVLKDLCDGLSYKDIAKKRFVEDSTIRSQVSRIAKKFDVASIEELIALINDLHFFDIVSM